MLTETASDDQVSFYMQLQLPTENGMKMMTVNMDPGAQVNTIPLSRYQKLSPQQLDETRNPKPNSLSPTVHTWTSHKGKTKPFLGHFITEVQHTALPR